MLIIVKIVQNENKIKTKLQFTSKLFSVNTEGILFRNKSKIYVYCTNLLQLISLTVVSLMSPCTITTILILNLIRGFCMRLCRNCQICVYLLHGLPANTKI